MFHRKQTSNLKFTPLSQGRIPIFNSRGVFLTSPQKTLLLYIAFEMRCTNEVSEVNIIRLKRVQLSFPLKKNKLLC